MQPLSIPHPPQTTSHTNVWGLPGQYVSSSSYTPSLPPHSAGVYVTSQQYVTSSPQHHPTPSIVSPALQTPGPAIHPVQGLPIDFQRAIPSPQSRKTKVYIYLKLKIWSAPAPFTHSINMVLYQDDVACMYDR
jgi:hypothetical protein